MNDVDQLQTIKRNIIDNIDSLQKLIKESQELKSLMSNLQPEDKKKMEDHLERITKIIETLTNQTLEMFDAFRKFVK